MISIKHTSRKLAAALLVIGVLGAGGAATAAGQPVDDCNEPHIELALAQSLDAREVGIVLARELSRPNVEVIRSLRADVTRLELERRAAEVRAVAWVDRDIDRELPRRWKSEWRHVDVIDIDGEHDDTPGLAGAFIDVIVDVAQLPAKAGLVADHLFGAAGKVTPRLLLALY